MKNTVSCGRMPQQRNEKADEVQWGKRKPMEKKDRCEQRIENEYGDTEAVYGAGGKSYSRWAANMALSQNIGVPWIMCQQYDAPDNVVMINGSRPI
ncbi:hypothetical protein BHM03_00058711 [Ensete ventricosum]|nr:hypothetical protein BHM03_00058711 [Ensete ventricosum]